jgi:NitT/TauT family transport system substrate-binding protein
MKKLILTTLILVSCLCLALSGCTGSPAQQPPSQPAGTPADIGTELLKATVGYWGGTCESPIFVAYEQGFFKEAGLDVELLLITGDTAVLMAGGELDAFELTPDQFKPMEQGVELKIIDSLHKGCIQGATTVDSGIKTVADLEGKRVAAAVGSIPQIQISSQMVLLGKDPTKVEWLDYPLPQMEEALDRGEVDAFAAYDPWTEIAVQNGKVKFFSNTHDEGLKDTLCCFIGMSQRTLDANPEIARRMSQAFSLACDYLNANPAAAAAMEMEKGYIAGDEALNAQLIEDYTWVAGDRQVLEDSVREIWHQIYRAGAMPDAPEDIEGYIEELSTRMVAYYGE